jgi:hypothetical protein
MIRLDLLRQTLDLFLSNIHRAVDKSILFPGAS